MRWIYFSPHLDDAVLSAGGLIHEQTHAGNPVEIWTFMGGFPPEPELSPFAQVLHSQWSMTSAEEVVRGRREEDIKAAGLVGAEAIHFDFLDCIYRRGKNGEWLYSDVFIPPHDDDNDLAARIAKSISARLQTDDKLVCPLAIGSHVDHVLVRRAVELLSRPLYYDADIPYHFNFPDELIPKTAGMKETVHAVSETGLESWQEAIGAYASQVSLLFETDEVRRAKIRQYWLENKGIRLWSFG
jgi:LmbE family N-acetylglucosaminyl deacetylase